MDFRVGQKVVCVDDNGAWGDARANGIFKDGVYTVTKIDGKYIDVAEAKRGGWLAKRFRPAVETDISIFTAMLTEPPRELVTDDEFHASIDMGRR